MKAQEKAQELVSKFADYVSGYVGSSFLTNYEYPDQILAQAKKVATITVDEILKQFDGLHKPEYCAFDAIGERKFTFKGEYPEHMTGYDMVEYWKTVKREIDKVENYEKT